MLDTQQDVFEPSAADTVQALMRFLRVLRYRRSYVLAAVGIAALLGALYYFTATRIYQATASLLILQTGAEVWNASMSPEGPSSALIPTYESLFYRDVVVKGAIHKLQQAPPEMRVDLVGRPPNEWPDVIRGNLTAAAARRTNLIDIRCRSENPRAAEAMVEALTESYLEFMEKNHRDVSAEIVLILDKERAEIEGQLSQLQLECFNGSAKHGTWVCGKADVVHPAVQRVMRLNETLVEVQQQRLQLQASLSAIRAAVHRGGDLRQHLITVEPMVGRELILSAPGPQSEVHRGRERRGKPSHRGARKTGDAAGTLRAPPPRRGGACREHPQRGAVPRRPSGEDQRPSGQCPDGQLGPMLVSMVEEKLAEVWIHESEAAREYAEAESEAVELNDRMAALAIVEHKLRLKQALHDTLLDRIANIDIHQDQADVRVAVVSEPKALNRPVSPKLSLVALLCLLGGLGGGALVVYVLDLLDDRFRSPEELKDQLAVPLLAMIRKLSARGDCGAQSLQVHVAATSVESEAFRTLRTTLAFCGQDMERIVVTSPEPGDGKTTVMANLAASYAQAGKRTLLIDADMRRPGLTKLFQLRSSPGLSDVLRSDEDAAAGLPTAHSRDRHRTPGRAALRPQTVGPDRAAQRTANVGPGRLGRDRLRPGADRLPARVGRQRRRHHWAPHRWRGAGRPTGKEPPTIGVASGGELAEHASPRRRRRGQPRELGEGRRLLRLRLRLWYGYGYGYGSGYGDQEEATGDLEQDEARPAGQAAQHSVPRRAA